MNKSVIGALVGFVVLAAVAAFLWFSPYGAGLKTKLGFTNLEIGGPSITSEGAAQLKAELDNRIKSAQTQFVLASGVNGLEPLGQVIVEPKSGYYAIILPKMKLTTPEGISTTIDTININAVPLAGDQKWTMTVALPASLTLFNAQGVQSATLAIGKQDFRGLWDKGLGGLSQMDANYSGLTVTDPNKVVNATIASILSHMDLKQGADGKWSGPAHGEANTIAMSTADKPDFLKIGKVSYDFAYKGYDKVKMDALRASLEAKAATPVPTTPAANTTPVASALQQHQIEMLDMIAALGEQSGGFKIQDVAVKFDPTMSGSVKEFGIDSGLKNIAADVASVDGNLHIYMKDLAVTMPGDYGLYIPDQFDLAISVEKLPLRAIVNAGPSPMALQSAIGPDFKIKLDNLHLSNTIFSSDMSGELHFDAASGRMAGAFKAKLKGLAALIQAIDAKSAALPPAQAMTAGQATMSLKMADAMGQPDATDPTTKIYNIVLDSNGISLNGKLMMPMPTAPPAFSPSQTQAPVGAVPPAITPPAAVMSAPPVVPSPQGAAPSIPAQ